MPITKAGRPCRDCKSITCYCHDRPQVTEIMHLTLTEPVIAWTADGQQAVIAAGTVLKVERSLTPPPRDGGD